MYRPTENSLTAASPEPSALSPPLIFSRKVRAGPKSISDRAASLRRPEPADPRALPAKTPREPLPAGIRRPAPPQPAGELARAQGCNFSIETRSTSNLSKSKVYLHRRYYIRVSPGLSRSSHPFSGGGGHRLPPAALWRPPRARRSGRGGGGGGGWEDVPGSGELD